MDSSTILSELGPYIGTTGVTTIALGAFIRYAGAKWIDNRFSKELQDLKSQQERVMHSLKSEQEHAIRFVQSTIDREIHRAKKLYDREFEALSESWRMLRAAYDLAASSIGSMTTDVKLMNNEELERHLEKRGMEEWQRKELQAMTGDQRQDEYWKWSDWQKCMECNKRWRECSQQIDSTSIFFPAGFTEKFRSINEMVCSSNVEYEERIRQYKVPRYGPYVIDDFEWTKNLRTVGKEKMDELETMVRDRLWSVAKESAASV